MTKPGRVHLGTLTLAAFLAPIGQPASAQEMAQKSAQEDEILEEIVVRGSVSQSLAKQIDIKRNTTEFVDGLVAVDFARFPDNNLGEALQRIPGVVVDRNDGGSQTNAIGEGGTINVRGLGPDFTRTEINGVTATNPGQQRGFGFNVLASELFQNVVVQKSLNAADNEGGLAGTVTLNTYRPLSVDDRVLTLTPRLNYIELSEDVGPGATLVYLDQAANRDFGFAFVVNYIENAPQENSVNVANWDFLRDSMRGNFGLLTPEEQAQFADTRIPRDPRLLVNAREQTRLNLAVTFERKLSDRLHVAWDNLYANLDHSGWQTRNDWPIEGFPATFLPPDIQMNGNQFISGTFPAASHYLRILDYEYDVKSTLHQSIVSADWDLSDKLRFSPRLGYSIAKEKFEWNDFDVRSANTDIFYQFDGEFVTATPTIGSVSDPSLYTVLARIRNRPDTDEDTELSLDLDFDLNIGRGAFTSFEFGLRYADREKEFRDFDGRADLSGFTGDVAQFVQVNDFDFGGSSLVPDVYLSLDTERLRAAAAPDGFTVNPIPRSNYDVSEESLAAYGMLNFGTNVLTGNLGLRLVRTDQTSEGTQVVGGENFPAKFDRNYTYALPSLNLKWDINDDLVGRFAAYRSLTRPRLTDVAPGRTFENFDGGSGTAGNPDLDPFTASNFDIGLEWYFADDAALTAAVFHKDLNGLIERIVEEVQVVDPGSGQTITINLSRPVNADGAEVTGFELGLQTPFSYGSGPLSNAGIQLTAAFADSEADFTNTEDLRSSTLEGLSEESYNAILYYDVERFNARLAYNWRSGFLQRVSGSGGNPISRDDYGQLDFSSTVNFTENISATLDIINLTDEQLVGYTFLEPRFVAGTSDTGRRYLLSATFRF